jgi:hypothetical protein
VQHQQLQQGTAAAAAAAAAAGAGSHPSSAGGNTPSLPVTPEVGMLYSPGAVFMIDQLDVEIDGRVCVGNGNALQHCWFLRLPYVYISKAGREVQGQGVYLPYGALAGGGTTGV